VTSDIRGASTDSGESVLARVLRLRDLLQYGELVKLCEQESLEVWFRDYCASVRPPTLASLRERLPHVDEERLQKTIALYQARWDPSLRLGTASYLELSNLKPEDFAVRWLEYADIRCSILRRLRERGRSAPSDWVSGEQAYIISPAERIADDRVRIAYRPAATVGEPNLAEARVEELRRGTNGVWRLIAHDGLLQDYGASVYEFSQELLDLLSENP
jgi:hypothetical protein